MARQNFVGVVVSQGKMMKTVKVRVEKKKFDARINKFIFLNKDYLVHDEAEVSREGDTVRIESTRPLSKRKFFSVAEILKNKGQQNALYEEDAKRQLLVEENNKTREFLDRRQHQADNADVSLVSDVMVLQNYYKDPTNEELIAKYETIKERYNLTDDLSSDSIKKLLTLDLHGLQQRTLNRTNNLIGLQVRLTELMQDQEKCNAILINEMNVENPELLKKHTKKNLLRKYLLK